MIIGTTISNYRQLKISLKLQKDHFVYNLVRSSMTYILCSSQSTVVCLPCLEARQFKTEPT
jgi:hypothetical protein